MVQGESSSATSSSASAGGAATATSSSTVTASSGGMGGVGTTSTSSGVATSSAGSGGAGTTSTSSSAATGSGGSGTASASSSSTSASSTGSGGSPGTGGGPTGTEAVAYGIDAAHTGAQPGETIFPPFQQRWAVTLGQFVSYPVIAGGRVFVTVRKAGTNSGTSLYALDQQTGAIAWGPIVISGTFWQSNAAYDSGKVFVQSDSGQLRAFDAVSGAQLWMANIGGMFTSIGSPPTARAGRVYMSVGGSIGSVSAIDEGNGQVVWSATVTNGMNSSPVVTDTGIYVSYDCNQVYDFHPITGALLWHHQTSPCSAGGGFTPVLFSGRVYARDLFLPNLVLDAQTGAQLGTFTTPVESLKTRLPAFHGTLGFFILESGLVAEAAATLAPVWSFPVASTETLSAPIVVNGVVYALSSTGMLYALTENDGSMVWSADTGGAFTPADEYNNNLHPFTGLAAAGGALIVPAGGRLVAYW